MSAHLELEILEDRSCPSTHIWQGPATGGVWSNPANWIGGVPTSNETGGTVLEFDGGIDSTDDVSGLVIFELHFAGGGDTLRGAPGVTLGIMGVGDSQNGGVQNISLLNDTGTNTIDASLPVNISNSFAYLVITAGQVTVASPISGNGFELAKGSANGTLGLTAAVANSYGGFFGSTKIDEGTLLLDDTGGLAVPGTLALGSGAGNGHALVRWLQPNQVSHDANVLVFAASRLDFDGFAQSLHGLEFGAANFGFQQASTADANGVHTAYTFTIDGAVTQTNDNVSIASVYVAGSSVASIDTSDTYVGTDGQVHETAEAVTIGFNGSIYPLDSQGNPVNPSAPFLAFGGFFEVYATLGAQDVGAIVRRPGVNNVFVSAGHYAYQYTSGGGASNFDFMQGGKTITGYGNPPDTAYLYDGSGPSTYTASGTAYCEMSGTDNGSAFADVALGYGVNKGIAQHPSQDVAYFYDSPGNDSFSGFQYAAFMRSADGTFTEDNEAYYFSQVYFYSFVGGHDIAYIYAATVNHASGPDVYVVYTTPEMP